MTDVLQELIDLLTLERIEAHLFRGQSQDLGWGSVFGGQVLGQALSAAIQTVPSDRHVHSLHSYFLRPGDVHQPIVYEVERIRERVRTELAGVNEAAPVPLPIDAIYTLGAE